MSDDKIVNLQERIDADWPAALTKKGHQATIAGDERNVLQALRTAPELRGLLRFDEFGLKVELTRSPPWRKQSGEAWTDTDDTQLAAWLQAEGIAVRGTNVVTDCVAVVAHDNTVHPVREYLDSLKWDGKARFDSWLERYCGAEGNTAFLSAAGRCWLISAVARVKEPGCKADYVIVLESKQGVRKSTAVAILAARDEWFADNIGDLRNKDSAIQLCGKWIIELAELSSVRRAEVEAVKGYISRTQDVYRPPYGRRAVTVPRQCVFVGTTNEHQYLRDRTGNRRYWPVKCTEIDIEALRHDRDQLWAEAVHAYNAGEQWYLPPALEALAAAEQDDRLYRSELDTLVADYLENRTEVTTRDVFTYALNLNPDSDKYAEQTAKLGVQVAAAIEAAGWERVRRVGREKRTVYRRVDRIGQDKLIPLHARVHTDNTKNNLSNPVHMSANCPKCDGEGCPYCDPRPA